MHEQTRKLATIVFTDIVGFTKLTAEDQQKASDLLDLQRTELKPLVESYGGKWVKEMGDGLILTFDTITSAVQCCLKIQRETKGIENLSLRIGIHLGEILEKENDIIGDDVNITARIEPFSAPGGIAISNKVHDAIVRESEFNTKYLGKPKLKGVGQKVEVYCITSHGLPETILSDVSAKLEHEGFQWNLKNTIGVAAATIGLFMLVNFLFLRIGYADEEETPSIAILPFENKGAEGDEFYAYGISSDLIADVTSAGLIRVASLMDIEKLDFQDMEATDLAKKLFVRYVAQGTLWKMDSVFQLSMEIFDTKESKVVYTKRWQTNWTDLSTIKGDLSDNILETLEIKILQDPEKHILESNPKAYAYYLEAKHKYEKREDRDDIEIARGLLDRAIKLDDNFIKAKLLLGETYHSVGDYDKAMDIYNSALGQAEDLGDKVAIGDALVGIGHIHNYRGEDDQAYDYYKRVLVIVEELRDMARIGRTLIDIGNLYEKKGDNDEALDFYQRALIIDEELGNKNSITINNIAIIYAKRGDIDQALDYFNRSLAISEELNDNDGIATSYVNIGLVHNVKGEYDQAIDYLSRGIRIGEELGDKYFIGNNLNNIGYIYIAKGEYNQAIEYQKRALQISEELGNKEGMANSLGFIADIYSKKGEYDQALDYCNRSLTICEEQGYKRKIDLFLNMIGDIHLLESEYDQAADYYTRSLKIKEGLGEEHSLGIITNLYLANKHLGKEYDIQEIHKLIGEADEIDYRTNFNLYELLDDKLYLEKAYDQIQEKVGSMEDDIRETFLTYPIPRRIILEWQEVS
jgi:tetratricopeptide (TPR) repeat protein/class 3 adenylate cyclase